MYRSGVHSSVSSINSMRCFAVCDVIVCQEYFLSLTVCLELVMSPRLAYSGTASGFLQWIDITVVNCYTHTHTHAFNGPFSGTTRVSQYQKGKTNLDFTEARDSEWQWHQLGRMQVCTSLQTDNHASTPPLSFFTGRMPFLLPNQQRQSTEGMITVVNS